MNNINPKNNLESPEIVFDVEINTLNTKGPNAAIAAVQPITPAAFLGESEKIIGNCLKVAAFPMPVKKNISITIPTK